MPIKLSGHTPFPIVVKTINNEAPNDLGNIDINTDLDVQQLWKLTNDPVTKLYGKELTAGERVVLTPDSKYIIDRVVTTGGINAEYSIQYGEIILPFLNKQEFAIDFPNIRTGNDEATQLIINVTKGSIKVELFGMYDDSTEQIMRGSEVLSYGTVNPASSSVIAVNGDYIITHVLTIGLDSVNKIEISYDDGVYIVFDFNVNNYRTYNFNFDGAKELAVKARKGKAGVIVLGKRKIPK